jgi:hypothetical protein
MGKITETYRIFSWCLITSWATQWISRVYGPEVASWGLVVALWAGVLFLLVALYGYFQS